MVSWWRGTGWHGVTGNLSHCQFCLWLYAGEPSCNTGYSHDSWAIEGMENILTHHLEFWVYWVGNLDLHELTIHILVPHMSYRLALFTVSHTPVFIIELRCERLEVRVKPKFQSYASFFRLQCDQSIWCLPPWHTLRRFYYWAMVFPTVTLWERKLWAWWNTWTVRWVLVSTRVWCIIVTLIFKLVVSLVHLSPALLN